MKSAQKDTRSNPAIWMHLASPSRGALHDKRVANEIHRAQERLHKRQKRTLLFTLAFFAVGGFILTPIATPLLHERTVWGLLLFVTLVVLDVLWIVQLKMLYDSWTFLNKLKKSA